jgi:hypothetical protein
LIINYLSENEIRKQADKPTNKMVDLWQQLCLKEIGHSVEVLVFNRRDSPYLENCDGVNTNYLINWKGNASLGLFLDDTLNLNYKIVTHELGHWILKLQGEKLVRNNDEEFGVGIEMLLNNLCSHPALYKIQRSVGHEPQREIDSRTNHDIVLASKIVETDDPQNQIENAIYFSDDLINCSENHRKGLQRIISNKLPRTDKMINIILEIKGTKDISIIENANTFPLEIIKQLRLGGNWSVGNSVEVLKNFVLKLSQK